MTHTHYENEFTKPCDQCKYFNNARDYGYCDKKGAYTSIARITSDGKTRVEKIIDCFEQKL